MQLPLDLSGCFLEIYIFGSKMPSSILPEMFIITELCIKEKLNFKPGNGNVYAIIMHGAKNGAFDVLTSQIKCPINV